MRYLFVLCSLLLLAPAPVMAQGGNLSYTTKGGRKERTGGHMNYKALQYGAQDLKADKSSENEAPAQDEKAADEAWEKYKALAAGTYKDPEEEDTAEKAAQPATAEPAAPTGLAGILDQYSRNKQQRSQMRTIRVAPEKAEETEKEAEKETEKKKED